MSKDKCFCGKEARTHEGKIQYEGFKVVLCDEHFKQFVELQQDNIRKALEKELNQLKRNWAASIHTCNTYANCRLAVPINAGIDSNGEPVMYCPEFMKNIKQGTKCQYRGYRRDREVPNE
jgi:hypothetical protein